MAGTFKVVTLSAMSLQPAQLSSGENLQWEQFYNSAKLRREDKANVTYVKIFLVL